MQILITGGSRGIGAGLVKHFTSLNYDVVSVSRSDTTSEQGDITDSNFRSYIANKYSPDIFINNAGIAKESLDKVLETNGVAAVDLLEKFYNKMNQGTIINIGSLSATKNGYEIKDISDTAYILSKKLLHEASYFFQEMHTKPIKVVSLEIGAVATSIQNRFYGKTIPEEEYTKQTIRSIPMLVDDVVTTVDWIINQPPHLELRSIQLNNFVLPDGKKL